MYKDNIKAAPCQPTDVYSAKQKQSNIILSQVQRVKENVKICTHGKTVESPNGKFNMEKIDTTVKHNPIITYSLLRESWHTNNQQSQDRPAPSVDAR